MQGIVVWIISLAAEVDLRDLASYSIRLQLTNFWGTIEVWHYRNIDLSCVEETDAQIKLVSSSSLLDLTE